MQGSQNQLQNRAVFVMLFTWTVFALVSIRMAEMMQHSRWLMIYAVAAFSGLTRLVWYVFRPKTEEDVMQSRPFFGFRFMAGFSGAMNFSIFSFFIFYLQGSIPVMTGDITRFGVGWIVLCLCIPATIWASTMAYIPAAKASTGSGS